MASGFPQEYGLLCTICVRWHETASDDRFLQRVPGRARSLRQVTEHQHNHCYPPLVAGDAVTFDTKDGTRFTLRPVPMTPESVPATVNFQDTPSDGPIRKAKYYVPEHEPPWSSAERHRLGLSMGPHAAAGFEW